MLCVVYHDCDDDEYCRDEGAELSPTPTLHHQRRTSKTHYHSISIQDTKHTYYHTHIRNRKQRPFCIRGVTMDGTIRQALSQICSCLCVLYRCGGDCVVSVLVAEKHPKKAPTALHRPNDINSWGKDTQGRQHGSVRRHTIRIFNIHHTHTIYNIYAS